MACSCQFFRMLVILIKLKSWKFIFLLVVLAAAASELYLFDPMDSWVLRFGEQDLQVVKAKEYQEKTIILGDVASSQDWFDIMTDCVTRQTKKEFKDSLEPCKGSECDDKYFQLLAGKRAGKLAHFVDFGTKTGKAKLRCQITTGMELFCPFTAYLIGLAQQDEKNTQLEYQSNGVFRLLSMVNSYGTILGGNNTVCKKNVNFATVFPRTLMVQMICVITALGFYLLVCTVTTIYELKSSGFLQLMFRRDMSLMAYWVPLWIITLLEMALVAAVITLAYSLHCPGFFATQKLLSVFLSCLLQLCCAAVFVLFTTVLARNIAFATLLVCVIHVAAGATIFANRVFLSQPQGSYTLLRCVLLVIPYGHIAEQVHHILLKEFLPKNAIMEHIVLPASAGMLVVVALLTIYLDSALTSGNGRRLPLSYFFRSRFWGLNDDDRVVLEEPEPPVMVENASDRLEPALRVCRLTKFFNPGCGGTATKALKDFSVRIYRDQITAVVGHNGSGKSTLMQLLSGERHPTEGGATFNKILITDPLYRCHIGRYIGYCPQTDALVNRLTMLDTLKLAASSSGFDWDDAELDVQAILSTLMIEDKLSHSIGSLSSCDRRKVCLTMALVGKPKLVLLDSPSTDMDFVSKRRMWKLLHEYKIGRTIIFSTLFMDEADGMADKIIFLSGGRLICSGTSFFIKRAFDCRYIFQVASKTEFHVPFIIRKVVTKFNSVRVRSVARADLELEVPITEDDILPAVALEVENMSELIDEFGIAQYSLDDVFCRLKGLTPAEVQANFLKSTIGYVADDVDRVRGVSSRSEHSNLSDSPALVEVESSKLRTIAGIMSVQFLQIRRSKVALISRIGVPLLFLLMLLGCAFLEKRAKNDQMNLVFNLSKTDNVVKDWGACLVYTSVRTDLHIDVVRQDECNMLLHGVNATLPNVNIIGMGLDSTIGEIYELGNFVQAMHSPTVQKTIKKICRGATGPCPLTYTTNLCPDRGPINTTDILVGSYVSRENYDPVNVSLQTIETYKNAFTWSSKLYRQSSDAVVKSKVNKEPEIEAEGIQDIRGIFFSFYALFVQIAILAVMPAIYLNDVIQDKLSGVRGQLHCMGMTRLHYWICTSIAHWIQLAAIYFLSILLLVAFASPCYTDALYLVAVVLPTLTLGLFNSLLCVYAVSSLVSGISYLVIINYSCFTLLVSLSVVFAQSSDGVTQVLTYALPHFAIIAPTFFGIRFIHYARSFFKSKQQPSLLPYAFVMMQTRDAFIALVIHFVLLILLLILLENRSKIFGSCCKGKVAHGGEKHGYENCNEGAIVEEVNKLEHDPKNAEHLMEVSQLGVKTREGKLVLRNLTFGLKFGETIGLIGPSGSGKTAALQAMVSDLQPSTGRVDIHVKDRWLSSASAVMQGFVGYCPKYDPLFQRLTVEENLVFYVRAAGIPYDRVQQILRSFNLESVANVVALHATVAVKRRLTLAISVLASPRMLVIDQVTAGVDTEGRQIIWQAIKSLADKQRGMVVGTQSMEEAENLCDRICILNAGMMAALSSMDELLCRYKTMYFIEIHIGEVPNETTAGAEARKDEIRRAVLARFFGCVIIEQLTFRMQFGVPIRSIGCMSSALDWLVAKKKAFNLLYFSIHYATIDQTMKAIIVHHETRMLMQQEADEAAVREVNV